MPLTSRIRTFVNTSAEKINKKLDEIEAKKLAKITMKEELKAQRTLAREELKKKKEEKAARDKEKIRTVIHAITGTITGTVDSIIYSIKLFYYRVLSKCSSKIEKFYAKKDYKNSVKEHKEIVEILYSAAGIGYLAREHDNDLVSRENVEYALSGVEPPNHRYINKHHIDYWVKDGQIIEIPFISTIEIMCDLFALAYDKNTEAIDYNLLIELLNDTTKEYTINEVLVKYFKSCICHAQKNKLIAPDYNYCDKTYKEIVQF